MSIDRRNVRGLVRSVAYDVRGTRLGRVAQVFLDDRSDEPAWVAVDVTRTRGMRLLPLAGAALKGRHLVIRAERTTVRSAPRIDLGDGQLSSQDEQRLLEHYGLPPAAGAAALDTAEQRPASPWPDDNERETAWERPVPETRDSQDTPVTSRGWDQPTQGSGEIGDRGASRRAGAPAEETGWGAAPGQHRDTAPTPVTPAPTPVTSAPTPVTSAPTPTPASAPTPTPASAPSPPLRAAEPVRRGETSSSASAPSAAPADSAPTVPPTQGWGAPATRPDAAPPGPSTSAPTR